MGPALSHPPFTCKDKITVDMAGVLRATNFIDLIFDG